MANNQEKEESSMIGRKGIVHDEEGNEVIGEVVFARKANYKKPSWILELEESDSDEKERYMENIHYKYYKEEESLNLFDEKERKTDKKTSLLAELEHIPIELASTEQIKEWSYGEVKKPKNVYYCNHHKGPGLLIDKIFGKDKWES